MLIVPNYSVPISDWPLASPVGVLVVFTISKIISLIQTYGSYVKKCFHYNAFEYQRSPP